MIKRQTNSVEEKILAAARLVFVRKGMEDATMGDIANEAEISRTSLNYYFRTKEKLFERIFEGILRDFWAKIEKVLVKDKSILEKFEEIIDIHTGTILRNSDIPPFLVGELSRDPKGMLNIVAAIFSKDEGFINFVGQIKDEMDRGVIKTVPYVDIFTTYAGMMLFPFFTKKALELLFLSGGGISFEQYVTDRRALVMQVMRDLLLPR